VFLHCVQFLPDDREEKFRDASTREVLSPDRLGDAVHIGDRGGRYAELRRNGSRERHVLYSEQRVDFCDVFSARIDIDQRERGVVFFRGVGDSRDVGEGARFGTEGEDEGV